MDDICTKCSASAYEPWPHAIYWMCSGCDLAEEFCDCPPIEEEAI